MLVTALNMMPALDMIKQFMAYTDALYIVYNKP